MDVGIPSVSYAARAGAVLGTGARRTTGVRGQHQPFIGPLTPVDR